MPPEPSLRQRWILVLVVLALGLVGDVVALRFKLGWPAAAGLSFGLAAVFGAWAWLRRDVLFGRLLLFGALVGLAELPSDHFAVVVNKTLTYAEGCPTIWASPFYMPVSWLVLMVQLGFIAHRLVERIGLTWATLLIALLGAVNIPTYEYLAYHAGFWVYHDTPMVGAVTPIYVILGELLLALSLPYLVQRTIKGTLRHAIESGLLQGLWIYLATRIAWWLTGTFFSGR